MPIQIIGKEELGDITINELVEKIRVSLRNNEDFNFKLHGIEYESYYFANCALYHEIERELKDNA